MRGRAAAHRVEVGSQVKPQPPARSADQARKKRTTRNAIPPTAPPVPKAASAVKARSFKTWRSVTFGSMEAFQQPMATAL